MSDGVQLDYAVASDPFPLQASPATGDLVSCVLTVLASNPAADPGTQPVTIEGIELTVPVGGEPSALTPDATDIDAVPPGGWTPQPGTPAGVYAFVPPGGSIAVGAEPLVFVLAAVQVNRVPGTVEGFTVQEGSGGCEPPDCPTVPLPLVKFPNGWGKVEFDVDPPDIKAGLGTSLTWSGPAGGTYALEWATPAGVVNVPAPGQPALAAIGTYPGPKDPPLKPAATTTFTLTVTETVDNVKYAAQVQKTVTVEQPAPAIDLFAGTVAVDAEGDHTATLRWDTTDADYCLIPAASPQEFAPSSPAAGYAVPVKAPVTFQLEAVRDIAGGGAKTTGPGLSLAWEQACTLPVDFADGRVVPALSPDGARLYVSSGDVLTGVYQVPSAPATVPDFLGRPQFPADWVDTLMDFAVGSGGDRDAGWAISQQGTLWSFVRGLFDAGGSFWDVDISVAANGDNWPWDGGRSRIATSPGAVYFTFGDGLSIYGFAVDGSGNASNQTVTALGPPLGDSAIALAAAADGTLYTATASGSIDVYSTASNKPTGLTAQHPVAAGATIEDLGLGGGCLFVALGNEVLVLDAANGMAPACDPIAVAADAIAVSADGLRLYACNSGSGNVQILAATAFTGGVPG